MLKKNLLLIPLVVLAAIFWLVFHPRLVWDVAEKYFFPKDLKISWQKIDFQMQHQSLTNWKLNLNIQGLKVSKSSPHLDVSLDEVSLGGLATIFSPKTHLDIQNFMVKSEQPIDYWASPSDSKEKTNYQDELKKIWSYIDEIERYISLEKASIDLQKINYFSLDGKALSGELRVSESDASAHAPLHFSLKLQDIAKIVDHLGVEGDVDLKKFNTPESFFNGLVKTEGKELTGQVPLEVTFQKQAIFIKSDSKLEYKTAHASFKASPTWDLMMNREKVDLRLKGSAEGFPGPLRQVKDVSAEFTLPIQSGWSTNPLIFKISWPAPLFFIAKKIREQNEASCDCKLPTSLDVGISGKLWPNSLIKNQTDKALVLEADILIADIDNKLLSTKMASHVKIERDNSSWLFSPVISANILAKSFQLLRKIADAYHLLVPAPISVLDGTISLTTNSPIEFKYENQKFSQMSGQAQAVIDLSSKNQRIKAKTDFQIGVDGAFAAFNIKVDSHIDTIQIELPPLDPLRGIPKTERDSRITLRPKVAPGAGNGKKFSSSLKSTRIRLERLNFYLSWPHPRFRLRFT